VGYFKRCFDTELLTRLIFGRKLITYLVKVCVLRQIGYPTDKQYTKNNRRKVLQDSIYHTMNNFSFIKMNGIGNDFVVVDCRAGPITFSKEIVETIANRHTGIGCDQLILIENAQHADAFMRIYNADGSEVNACGNAARCVASILLKQKSTNKVSLETNERIIEAFNCGNGHITVDMGVPLIKWQEIPLLKKQDTLHLSLSCDMLSDAVAVNMGNPHCIFFVEDENSVELSIIGPKLESHPIFPEKANIGIAKILSNQSLRLKVWERGVGITAACGTAACAAAIAAVRRGLMDRKIEVQLPGGTVYIEWQENNHVMLTGPVATNFNGVFLGECSSQSIKK